MFRRIFTLAPLWITATSQAAVTTETLAQGIFHDKYTLSGPLVIHVVRMDLSRPEYKVQLGFAQKKRNYTAKEKVSVICPRYEAASNHVIAAVNGSYFNVATGDNGISGMLVDSAGYVKLADASREMICFNDARELAIEELANSSSPTLTYADGTTASVNNYMMGRAANGLACYMTTWGTTTGTSTQGVEVVVTNVSYPIKPLKEVSGIVSAIKTGTASTNNAIPANGFVLSADGTAATSLLAKVAVGDRIYLKTSISKASFYWCNFALSGNGYLLKAGVPVDSGTTADPQTAMAWHATNLFLVTVDGRQPSLSIGLSWNDLGAFLTNTVGATDAIALDGGGSTTMWINGQGVVNSPSDGSERSVANAVMLVNQPTASTFPLQDDFTSAGRSLRWDDKFKYSDVDVFSPTAPGGDGYVMTVKNTAGGVESARLGDLADTNYTVQAHIYCDYRPTIAANGYELCSLFARDDGHQGFTSATYNGNCYALIYKSDTGELRAAKIIDGVINDLTPAAVSLTVSDWHKFGIRCYSNTIQFLLDDIAICTTNDTTFKRGYCGIGYHEFFSSNGNIRGTRADNFRAYVEASPFGVAASLKIGLSPVQGVGLTITGTTGATYRIEFAFALASNWTTLTNIVLPTSPFVFTDSAGVANGSRRYYRALLIH